MLLLLFLNYARYKRGDAYYISLILWQDMADYGNSKSYCHTNIFL